MHSTASTLIGILLLVLFSSFAKAGEKLGTVTDVHISADGVLLFSLDEPPILTADCNVTPEQKLWQYELSMSAPYAREIFAFVLQAYNSQQNVRVGYSDECQGSRVAVLYVSHLRLDQK